MDLDGEKGEGNVLFNATDEAIMAYANHDVRNTCKNIC